MTMFNSQKINNDPKPHIDGHGNRFDAPFTHSLLAGCGEPCDTKHAPRPEFDNRPNPLLVEARAADTATKSTWGTRMMLDAINGGDRAPELFRIPAREATPEQIDHARKVLGRLTGLAGEAGE